MTTLTRFCGRLDLFGMRVSLTLAVGLMTFAAGVAIRAADIAEVERSLPGIADQKPEEVGENAQVVAIEDGGYMVPYEAKVPGFVATYHMTPIPGGTFMMGSPEDEEHRQDDEGPQFEVAIEPFWMGTYEVTWSEYMRFMDMYNLFKSLEQQGPVAEEDRVDAITIPTPLYVPSFTFALGDDPEHPAVTMTQYAARQYTMWLSKLTGRFYRLPTEAEWEYAARAGTTTAWSFGDDIEQLDDHAFHFGNAGDVYHHVGTLKPNPWGLHDMHGNVAELVMDQYVEDHYAQFAGEQVHYMDALVWPMEPDPIVVRGGSWKHKPEKTRTAYRWKTDDAAWKMMDPNRPLSPWWFTQNEGRATGFRIVRPLREPSEEMKLRFWGTRPKDIPDLVWMDVADRLRKGRGTQQALDAELLRKIKGEDGE
ncbi:MAG: formylglycine-generating enzyme family protein [Phycisphaeraceae bacterium]